MESKNDNQDMNRNNNDENDKRNQLLSQLQNVNNQINTIGNNENSNDDKQTTPNIEPSTLMAFNSNIPPHSVNNDDMNFTLELSENLLTECRKLQAINQKINKQLVEKSSQNKKVTDQLKKLTKEFQDSKNVTWELEHNFNTMTQDLKITKTSLSKKELQYQTTLKKLNDLNSKLEIVNLERKGLENNSNDEKKQLKLQLMTLKKNINDLNDENDQLNDKFQTLKTEKQIMERKLNEANHTIQELTSKSIIDTNEIPTQTDTQPLTLENVETFTKENNYILLPSKEFEQLKNPNSKTLIDTLERDYKDYKVLPKIDYDNIQNQLHNPSEEYLTINLIEKFNKKSIPKEKYDALLHPTPLYLIDQLKSKGYISIPKDEYAQLISKIEYPSLDHVTEMASKLNNKCIPIEKYESLTNPSFNDLREHVEKLGYKILEESEYHNLLDQSLHPTVDSIKKTALKDEEKLNLLKWLSEEQKEEYMVIPSKEYNEIVEPSEETLIAKCQQHEITCVPNNKFKELVSTFDSPSLEFLENKAKQLDHSILPTKRVNELINTFEAPSDEFLESNISKKGKKIVTNDRFNQLLRAFEADESYLNDKAKQLGKTLVAKDKYEQLLNTSINPSLEFLSDKASQLEMTMLSSTEYSGLKNITEHPSIEFLTEKASSLNYELLPREEYNKLQVITEDPSLDFLSEKAKEKNATLLPTDAYVQLEETITNPILSFLTEKAHAKDCVVINKNEYDDITRKAISPTKEELNQYAVRNGEILIPKEQYELLNETFSNPNTEFLKEKAQSHNMKLIDANEFESLQNQGSDKKFIEKSLTALGLMPVPVAALDSLKASTLENSNVSSINKRLNDLNYTATPNEELASLKTPIVEKATKDDTLSLCSKYLLTPIPNDEYTKLQNDAKPVIYSDTELNEMIKARGYDVLSQDEASNLRELAEHPSLQFLEDHATSLNKVIIDKQLYDEMEKQLETPSIEYLNAKANVVGYKIISEYDVEKLTNTVESPSLEYLTDKANSLDMTLINKDEKNNLLDQQENPTLDYLVSKCNSYNKTVIDEAEYTDLVRRLQYPTFEELHAFATKQEMTLIPTTEYSKLTEQIDNSSLQYLKDSLIKLDYVPLPKEELDLLKQKIETPTEEYLIEKAQVFNKLLVDDTQYENMVNSIQSPSNEYLAEKSREKDLVLVNTTEYTELSDKLAHPTENVLRELAAKLDKVVVDKIKYNNIIASVDSPSADHLAKKASALDLALVKQSEYNELKKIQETPSLDYIQGKLTPMHKLIVDTTEYNKLKQFETNPPIEFIQKKIAENDSIIINKADYENLQDKAQNPTLEVAEMFAKKHQYALLKKDELSGFDNNELSISNEPPVIISKERYDSLINTKAFIISKDDLIELCKPLNIVPMSAIEYEKLTAPLSEQDVNTYANDHSLILLPEDKYNELNSEIESPNQDIIDKTLNRRNMVAIPITEYDNLTSDIQKSQLSKEEPSSPSLGNSISGQDEKTELSQSNIVTTEGSSEIENSESRDHISQGLRKMNLSILPTDKHQELVKRNAPEEHMNYNDLAAAAKGIGMILVPRDDNLERITSQSTEQGTIYRRHDDTSSFISSNSSSTGTSIYYDAAQSNSRIDHRDLSSLIHTSTVSSASSGMFVDALDSNIHEQHDAFDNVSQTSTVRAPDDTNDSLLDLDKFKDRAKELGFILVPIDDTTQGNTKMPNLSEDSDNVDIESDFDENELLEKANKFGMSLISTDDYNTFKELQSLSTSPERLVKFVNDLGYVLLEENVYAALQADAKLNKEKIIDNSHLFGLKTLEETEYLELEKKLEDNKVTKENISQKARELGYLALSLPEYQNIMAQVNQARNIPLTTLEEKARGHDLVVLPHAEYTALLEPRQAPSLPLDSTTTHPETALEELQRNTDRINSTIVSQETHSDLPSSKEICPKNELIKQLASYDLIAITQERFEEIKNELENPAFTREQIMEQLDKLDLIAVKKGEVPTSPAGDEDDNFDDTFDFVEKTQDVQEELVQLKRKAKKYGLLSVPESSFIVTSYATEPDLNNVVILPVSYYNSLLSKENEKLHQVSNDALKKEANKRGFAINMQWDNNSNKNSSTLMQPPVIVSAASTPPIKHVSKSSVTSGDSIAGKQQAASVGGSVTFSDFDSPHSGKKSTRSRNTSIRRDPGSAKSTVNRSLSAAGSQTGASKIPRITSVDGGISLATVANLNDKSSIIPALTQTVVGEYLYKYYPRLGAFGGIKSRHERFFWIHPYNMTLYWSDSNPAMPNPGESKTKCAAILGVESVEDNNPFPAGLYHKSIIVKTGNRSVKFTCPTRQRHNIWFNSLRYLLQRSMDGINMEDIGTDPNDMLYSGRIFPLPGEDLKNTNKRLSLSRRAKSYSSLRHDKYQSVGKHLRTHRSMIESP
ncbi:Num1p NDAI_0J00960 [Naumovozyma dairenensis CBS 421]|uniref:PH domain-containing protein n=1 Tax=Naumovozyma dairenensis (strain ATCC 10597 / BCRC 20456 / CBS 421 / NBRC 0211 / NRRL Y-12639) TaxID=1071378 RepID=G0WGR0_NAUDC|nr:hypothetical protein NDAI_0J00960 [Naumovozyma dairenensis CBS 421]CCD26988.1 hypothetical protein NDAI_0J00960 [Naumovozyma dairenensis CBS 421]